MCEIFYNTVEFQAGVSEAADKIQVIIDNLRIVENNVASLGSELERYQSKEEDFLQLKWTADTCIKDTKRAITVASNLQAKQADLQSLITNSNATTDQARTLTLGIQHDSGAFSEIVSSLKQSYEKMQELAQSLQTLAKRPKPWWKNYGTCALVALGAVCLVVGLVTGFTPIVAGLCVAAAVAVCVYDKGAVMADSSWSSLPGNISTAQDTLQGIADLGQDLQNGANATLSLLDKYEAMEERIRELEEQLKQRS